MINFIAGFVVGAAAAFAVSLLCIWGWLRIAERLMDDCSAGQEQ